MEHIEEAGIHNINIISQKYIKPLSAKIFRYLRKVSKSIFAYLYFLCDTLEPIVNACFYLPMRPKDADALNK
ncbi:MAG: hypothetical protein KAJ93_05520, partial [Methanosarcinales archaeon]|nr:hypothetical protein [Methanosarcinales archaeon]